MSSSWQPEPEGAVGRDREMEGRWLWLMPCGFVFLLELIYSSDEQLFTFMIFYSGLITHRSPQVEKASKGSIDMFY